MSEQAELLRSASALRHAFDHSFALPVAQAVEDFEDLLLVRVGGDPFVIRLAEINGIVREIAGRRTIVPVPAKAPGLLGLAGIRGEIVPVFAMSTLLGYGPDEAPPSWIVLCGGIEPIALGIAALDGHLRLPSAALHARDDREPAHKADEYVDRIAATDAGPRPVVSIELIVATIHRGGQRSQEREQ